MLTKKFLLTIYSERLLINIEKIILVFIHFFLRLCYTKEKTEAVMTKKEIEELRLKYMNNPPEGISKKKLKICPSMNFLIWTIFFTRAMTMMKISSVPKAFISSDSSSCFFLPAFSAGLFFYLLFFRGISYKVKQKSRKPLINQGFSQTADKPSF